MNHIQFLCDFSELTTAFSTSGSISSFLDETVEMVATHMQTAVCSIYLYDEEHHDLVLESTIGLNREKARSIRLNIGEGITGLAVKELRTIMVNQASAHPNYRYFGGIDEEKYDAFMAVPLLRGIKRVGALVVQRDVKRPFNEDDLIAMKALSNQIVSTIETAHMLMVADQSQKDTHSEINIKELKLLKGRAASEGFALGPSLVFEKETSWKKIALSIPDSRYTIEDFYAAIKKTEEQLKTLQHRVEEKLSDVASLIFTAHLLILKDLPFFGKIEKRIKEGSNPPEAVISVAKEYTDIFLGKDDPYMREKAADVTDLSLRILHNIIDRDVHDDDYDGKIVIANELLPSDILVLSAERVAGIILVGGGVTSHLSILARSLAIPLLLSDEPQLLALPDATPICIDSGSEEIYIHPEGEVKKTYQNREQARATFVQPSSSIAQKTYTNDGKRVRIMANINLLSDVKTALDMKVEGIGLYRSEFPFMIRSTFPTEEEQFVIYKKLAHSVPDKILTFRTLDIGGDKIVSYYDHFKEKNPFLGLRSIRFTLSHKDVFVQQIRAILRAGVETKLKIIFPMISSLDEFSDSRAIVQECINDLQKERIPCNSNPEIGMMIELPSVVDLMDDFATQADFFSIGSNDFIQYLLAVDRTNIKVAHLYQSHHPSVLRSFKRIAHSAKQNKKEVSICGDMAHDMKLLPFLIGVGIRMLSVEPMYLPRLQKKINHIDSQDAENDAKRLLGCSTIKEVEEVLGL